MKLKHKKILNKLIITAIMLIVIGFLLLLKQSVWISEYIFSRGIARYYRTAVGYLTSAFRISIFEILLIIVVLIVVAFLIISLRWIHKKKWLKVTSMFVTIVMSLSIFGVVYVSTASLNYNRQPVPLPMYEGAVSSEKLNDIIYYFEEDFNQIAKIMPRDNIGNIIVPYSDNELANRLKQEFKRLDSSYFGKFVPTAKTINASKIMLMLNTIGIYFSPTSEANICKLTANIDKPVTMAHELAHSVGVMREDEANLVACYLTISSSDEYLRYSGYNNFLYQLIKVTAINGNVDVYRQIFKERTPLIEKENNNSREMYNKYHSALTNVSIFFNNLYLKLSGEKDGTLSYDDSSGGITDSGNVTEDGDIIYIITHSKTHKIFFEIYKNIHLS